ncbi:Lrp/AsnC family transcriptional regulator [Candidatus Micrarchaeota archaeon]|nr:Lrp/AsnC family transcriptional regulator [Candidatus Micrarchaeota archaeon]
MKSKHLKLDQIDREILKELRLNCRRSYRELAKAISISPAALIERMKQLEKEEYILGYTANINFLKLGYEFMGVVQISISHGALLDVQEKISKLPGVAAVYDITGAYDSEALVMCKSRAELSALIKKILKIPNVEKTNTNMVLNVMKDIYQFEGV